MDVGDKFRTGDKYTPDRFWATTVFHVHSESIRNLLGQLRPLMLQLCTNLNFDRFPEHRDDRMYGSIAVTWSYSPIYDYHAFKRLS